ncbi:unnamed protein product [Kluyveromyces dobzhanskii CBS 2104]|uniref:WGS project CCBQ000000000 data, contig 00058 n=1 Tax=Kluyveromyces dobzhanskii CBS 2104 TaxID=1427455 RepID=A0A0A8LC83_9SACH|nr:unnamed protein product [Kluyveromyces dobzhanskii CBS 2104]
MQSPSQINVASPPRSAASPFPAKDNLKNGTKQLLKTAKFLFPDYMGLYNLGILGQEQLQYCEYSASGFELYIVEQWVSERKFSNVITSFTGNPSEIVHGVLVRLPEDSRYWPESFKEYHDKLVDFSSVKEIDDGISLFVTNLSFFPSTLNLLHVKNGSMKESWSLFQVNFNLKRIGCGNRSGNLLGEPSITSLEKFAQIYKMTTKDPEDLFRNLIELVKVIQISLSYFRLLDGKFKDGTLCQHTVNAIQEWWISYGKLYLAIDRPKNEGILGPTTVAGIISFVLMCYFKFIVEDCISYKDPYIESSFYSGVYNFQRKYNLPKTSYLDVETMNKLFKVTSKATTNDIFKLKRALKSRVQDIARKFNPIQLANEILTTDLNWLIENVQGGYLGLFWGIKRQNKIIKRGRSFYEQEFNHGDPFDDDQDYITKTEIPLCGDNTVDLEDSNSWEDDSIKQESEFTYHCQNNVVFQKELYRRASIPQIDTEKNFFQVEYKNSVSADRGPEERSVVKRSYSFSDVQDSIEVWSSPFQISLVKIARDILQMERHMRRYYDESPVDKSEEYMPTVKSSLQRCQKTFEAIKHTESDLHSQSQTLHSEMKEINSLEAKFNYDLRILETRMRDVEENLNHFSNRLNSLESSFKLKGKKFKALIDTNILHSALELDKYAFEFFENEQVWNEGLFVSSLKQYIWPTVKNQWNRVSEWWSPNNL